jgi:hypothetical protein
MSNSRSQINSNFYQIANTDPTCGNITGVNVGNVWATGNVTAQYFFGNGSQLTGLPATYSNADVANYLQVLSSNVTTTANIQGAYILGNGSQLTGLPEAYSNANVANFLQTLTSNVTTTANVQASYFIGNGSQLTGLPAPYSNVNVAAYLSSNPNLNITINGTVTADVFYGDVIGNVQGNLTVTGANTGVLFKDGGNANAVTGFTFDKNTNTATLGANLTVGNVNAQFVYGNIRGTTGGYDDANVAAYLPGYLNTYTGNLQSGNLLVVNSAVIQGNLTVLGNTTTINANTLNINDKDITVANGAATAAEANGAGLIVGQGNLANIIFNNPANAWTLYPGIDTPGNITGAYIIGNGYYLNNVQASNIVGGYGNSQVAAYLQVLTSNITTTANIQAAYFIGNGSQLTGLPASYSNANVAAYLPVYGGNILGNVITGNLRAVSLLPAYANGQLANGDVNIGSVTNYFNEIFATKLIVPPSNTNNGFELVVSSTPGQSGVSFLDPITGTGVDIFAATGFFDGLDVTGNISAGTYIITPNLFVYDTANIFNLKVTGNANIAGNLITNNAIANFYYGNGAFLTGLNFTNYSNANVANFLATGFGSNTIITTGDITAGNLSVIESIYGDYITANINMVTEDLSANTISFASNIVGADADFGGNVIVGADVIVTGNITAALYLGNGYFLTDIQASNITGAYSNANVAAYLPTYTGNLALSSDIIALYANAATQSNAIANLQALQYANANVSNFLANGFGSNTITTTGNVTAAYYFGNGSQLTGIASAYGNANVAAYLASNSNIVITTTGNITTTANLNTNSIIGIPNSNTIITTNGYNWTFDITGNLVLPANVLAINFANGTQVSLGGSYSNANVANYLQVLSSNVTTTANVQANYFIGNGSQLTGITSTAAESFNPFLLAGM